MARPLTEKDAEALSLFQHRNRLLTVIREQSLCDPEEQSYAIIFQYCCDILAEAFHCSFVWAGDIDKETNCLIPYAASPPSAFKDFSIQNHLTEILIEQFNSDLNSFTKPLYTHFTTEESGKSKSANYNCAVWPVGYQHQNYGFLAMQCQEQINICDLKM
jgi:hypothetical protein